MIKMMFANGEEKQFKGDKVVRKADFIVIVNWNRRTRKWEDVELFQAAKIAMASDADGNIILGDGQIKARESR